MTNSAPDDSLDDVAVFVRVVETGSFTAAAERLGRSRPAVSKAVSRLEARLGSRLLNRTTRRLSLTETGRAFFDRCARGLQEIRLAGDEISSLQAAPRGLLRINAPMSFAILYLAPQLAAFQQLYPDIRIDLHLDDRKLDLVEEGFDVAVRVAALPDSSYVARRLTACRHVLCAAPTYLAAHGMPRSPAELMRHRLVTNRLQTASTRWEFRTRGGQAEVVDVTPSMQLDNSLAIKQAVLGGAGITRTPTFVVAGDLRSGNLVALLPDYALPEFSVYAMYPQRRFLAPKVRVFVDFLAGHLPDPPPWDKVG